MQREKKTSRRPETREAADPEVDPAALPDAPGAAPDADPAPVPEAPLAGAPAASGENEACGEEGRAGGRQGPSACAHDNEAGGQGRPAADGPDDAPSGRAAQNACEQDAQAVTQAQEGLAGRWARLGEGVFDPDALDPEILDEEGDLGRFDVHDPHQLGELGERLAARYLRGYGYTVLERNYRCEFGEADLICAKDDCVVLVEVKTRLGGEAMPEEAVTAQKLKRYRKITLAYLMSHEWFDSVRLDVLAINIAKPRRAQVHHFMGVCEWEG